MVKWDDFEFNFLGGYHLDSILGGVFYLPMTTLKTMYFSKFLASEEVDLIFIFTQKTGVK